MHKRIVLTVLVVTLTLIVDGKRTSIWSRGSSSRGHGSSSHSSSSSQKWNVNSHKTSQSSSSMSQAAAAKPAYTGWQQKPSNGQSPSYPSSNTGLSGNKPAQPPSHQDSIQRSSAPSNTNQNLPTNNQGSHSYPSSIGLSGNSKPTQHGTGANTGNGYPQQHGAGQPAGSGTGYPQQNGPGLSGAGSGYPQSHGTGSGYPQQGTGLSGAPAAPPPYSGYKPGQSYPNNNPNYHHPQGPPPPYHPQGPPPYSSSNYGGYGGYSPAHVQQMPGYFGSYGNAGKGFGGVSRTGSALTGVGIAGAGIGTVLTGLALWNLARSTGHHHHTVIYDNRGQPVAVAPNNSTTPVVDPMLADLVNCSLTISNENATDVLAIPCAIATSFSPEADVKDPSEKDIPNDNTKCTVTVLTKTGKEYMTTIPCSILLSTAAENNVTEATPTMVEQLNDTSNITDFNTSNVTNLHENNSSSTSEPTALKLVGVDINSNETYRQNCTLEAGEHRDPINPCYSVHSDLTVIPLSSVRNINDTSLDALHQK